MKLSLTTIIAATTTTLVLSTAAAENEHVVLSSQSSSSSTRDSLRGSSTIISKKHQQRNDNYNYSDGEQSSQSQQRSLHILDVNDMECTPHPDDPEDFVCQFRVKSDKIGPEGTHICFTADVVTHTDTHTDSMEELSKTEAPTIQPPTDAKAVRTPPPVVPTPSPVAAVSTITEVPVFEEAIIEEDTTTTAAVTTSLYYPPGVEGPCYVMPANAICFLNLGRCMDVFGTIIEVCCPKCATSTYRPGDTCDVTLPNPSECVREFVNDITHDRGSDDSSTAASSGAINDSGLFDEAAIEEEVVTTGSSFIGIGGGWSSSTPEWHQDASTENGIRPDSESGNVGTGQFCSSSSECIETTFCGSNNVCMSMGSCKSASDCANPSNLYISSDCIGTYSLMCRGVTCQKTCL